MPPGEASKGFAGLENALPQLLDMESPGVD